MKILMANKFFYLRGGTEYVFFDTVRLLEKHGHEISYFSMRHPRNLPTRFDRFFVSHTDYDHQSLAAKFSSGLRLLYSFEAKRKIGRLAREEKPSIAHVHNIYHQISPSILHSLRAAGIPVVMTLHDLKLVCPAYLLSRGGKMCTACAGRKYFNCVRYSCVKNSRSMSMLAALEMYLHHALLDIYRLVDVFICPSLFLKQSIGNMGFSGAVEHVPNFIELEGFVPCFDRTAREIVYFGRLSEEKGLCTLIKAMQAIGDIRLKIIGEGPLRPQLEAQAAGNPRIEFAGYKSGDELREAIRSAMFVVFPSECFENNPRSIIEAFALGKPVVGSNIGGVPELVRNGETGFLFEPGNAGELAAAIRRLADDPRRITGMGAYCRDLAEREFGAANHYQKLMKVYEYALEKHRVNSEVHDGKVSPVAAGSGIVSAGRVTASSR